MRWPRLAGHRYNTRRDSCHPAKEEGWFGTPKVLAQGRGVWKQAKVLVASCTGGLVLYQPGEAHSFKTAMHIKFEMPLELNLPRLENRHQGK